MKDKKKCVLKEGNNNKHIISFDCGRVTFIPLVKVRIFQNAYWLAFAKSLSRPERHYEQNKLSDVEKCILLIRKHALSWVQFYPLLKNWIYFNSTQLEHESGWHTGLIPMRHLYSCPSPSWHLISCSCIVKEITIKVTTI